MLIAIDGPAGAGKSSIAYLVACKLKYIHLDSGALYRALAYLAVQKKITPSELANYLARYPDLFHFSYQDHKQQIFLQQQDITEQIRTSEITALVKNFADNPECRGWVNGFIKNLSEKISLVIDGRDIGTVVFPNADFKFYLTARLEVRAQRRALEKKIATSSVEYQKLVKAIARRDEQDFSRKIAPLKQAADATLVDSSFLTKTQVVEKIYQTIKAG
jgi:cytidylate kinase